MLVMVRMWAGWGGMRLAVLDLATGEGLAASREHMKQLHIRMNNRFVHQLAGARWRKLALRLREAVRDSAGVSGTPALDGGILARVLPEDGQEPVGLGVLSSGLLHDMLDFN